MKRPNRGIGEWPGAPTLRSVRKLRNLELALAEINRRPVGVDGFTHEAYRKPFEYARWNPNFLTAYPELRPLQWIQGDISERFPYDPDPVEPVRVKGRVVYRGTVANRLIERAVARKLSMYLERHLCESSGAYRPGRSPENMILRVQQVIRSGAHWALKTDVHHFFDGVRRDILEKQLANSLADKYLCRFVVDALGFYDCRRGRIISHGLPQGNILAPVLCNLYLHQLDLSCRHLGYFRYGDDILVLAHDADELPTALEHISASLRQLGLVLNPQKTRWAYLVQDSMQFLGYELRGGSIYPPEEAILRLKRHLRVREHGARKGLMSQFVRRFRIGPVRKLFRRLDRDLHHLYPPGLTLTGLLGGYRGTRRAIGTEVMAIPRGNAV